MFLYLYFECKAFARLVFVTSGRLLGWALIRLVLGPADGRRPALRLALSFVVVLGFGYGFMRTSQMQAAARTAVPALDAGWDDVRRPLALYSLGGNEFGKMTRYEARRHNGGGGRQDFLTFGAFENDQMRYLTASFYRPQRERMERGSFFDTMVKRAAQSALNVARLDVPDQMESRFGVLEVADARLYSQGRLRNCLAYRLDSAEIDFFIAGFACGAGQVIDRLALACAIDRVDLLAAGDDDDLVRFFTRSEGRRGAGCVTKMGPGQKTTPWLDASAPIPPLRHAPSQIKVRP